MNENYKVTVLRHNKIWSEIAIPAQSSQQIIQDIAERYPKEEGFHCQLYQKTAEQRILSSDEQGIKILASSNSYTEMDWL